MKEILIAVVSLAVGAIVGPYINWGIEKRKEKVAYRRELIGKWRAMLAEALLRNWEETIRDCLQFSKDTMTSIVYRHELAPTITNTKGVTRV